MTWRGLPGFSALGSALAFGYRGDWLAAGVAAVCVLVPAVARLRRELLATRAMLRGFAEMSEAADRLTRQPAAREHG